MQKNVEADPDLTTPAAGPSTIGAAKTWHCSPADIDASIYDMTRLLRTRMT
jgi:hypothetical protein